MNKKDYPVQVIKVKDSDHRPPPETKPNIKSFGELTDEIRKQIFDQIDEALKKFEPQFARWPKVPAVLKVTLKDEALAKSYRPTSLFTRRTCPIIGTLGYGEVLVGGDREHIQLLQKVALSTKSKKPSANLTAIKKIEAYRLDLNMPEAVRTELQASMGAGIPLKLHTFDHSIAASNSAIEMALQQLASDCGATLRRFSYGKRCKGFLIGACSF